MSMRSFAFFDHRTDHPEEAMETNLSSSGVFSVVFATRDLLDSGAWRIVGRRPVELPSEMFPYENTREAGWVGAKVIGSGNLNEFVNAYFGLTPWDDWKDPTYLDKLLISPDKKPKKLLLKSPRQ